MKTNNTKTLTIVIGVLVALAVIMSLSGGNGPLGFDSENSGSSIPATDQFGTIASLSRQGIVKSGPTKVFSIEVTSSTNALRYFQIYDMVASSSNATHNPMGKSSYYSSYLLTSYPIPATTASSSPTIVRIDSDMFAPALQLRRGLIWGISSDFATYASASVESAKHTVKINYK